MLYGSQMWDCVGKRFDGVKPVLMVNRWGQSDFVMDKFVLVGTRGKSGVYSKPLCTAKRQYPTQVYSSMHAVSTPHLSLPSSIMFS